jgi:hypothetical protein
MKVENILTPWRKVSLEKIMAHLFKKFVAFNGSRMFIIAFTEREYHCTAA